MTRSTPPPPLAGPRNPRMRISWSWFACCCLVATGPCLGADAGTATLLDGKPKLLRGTGWLNLVEGVRIKEGDVIDVPEKGQFQLEFAAGGALSLIGPGALYVAAATSGDPKQRASQELWLSRGWLKFDTKAPGTRLRIRSGPTTVTASDGAAVMRVAGDVIELFVETGSARVADGAAGEVKAGSFASRSAGKSFAYAERAPSTFVAALPRDFMDPLPLRAPRFATAREPVPDREATYAEVQSWLTGPYRAAFLKRFEPKLADPGFRAAAEANSKATPEWSVTAQPKAEVPAAAPPKEEKKEPEKTWHWPWERSSK
jgi:hypothetical protein